MDINLVKMQQTIKTILIKIGIRCDLAGFQYLCHAIQHAILKPNNSKNLCSDIYVEIAHINNLKTYSTIERNIRHAIDKAYERTGFEELNRMFNAQLYTRKQKPTAGELIKLVSEYYLLDLYNQQLSLSTK